MKEVLAQDLTGVAKDGSGIKVLEESYSVLTLKVNRPRKRKQANKLAFREEDELPNLPG